MKCRIGEPLSQLSDTAHVIRVEMGDDQIVDLPDARAPRNRRDSIGVAAIKSWPTGIDQQRFARRRDEQRRFPAIDVDHVDIERFRGPGLGHRRRGDGERDQHEGRPHENLL